MTVRHALFLATVAVSLGQPPPVAAADPEVDFSCVRQMVRSMPQLSDRYIEYDVVLHNQCPGSAYWSLCIERVDPLSHAVVETHTPAGFIEAGAKSRVNLQLRKGPEAMDFRRRFQELYVGRGFALEPPARAACAAARCEPAKSELRRQIGANLDAWRAAERSLTDRLAQDCPATAWGKTPESEECEARVRAETRAQIQAFEEQDQRLMTEMRAAGGPGCEVYAGDLVTD